MANNEIPNCPTPENLRGEAAHDTYHGKTGAGDAADLSQCIFPIVRLDEHNQVRDVLGTGFFITTNGLFVTAKHVLNAPFDEKGRQRYPIGLLHVYAEKKYVYRHVLRCASHPIADVCVGVAAPMRNQKDGVDLKAKILSLTTAAPDLNTRIVTYAYPKYSIKKAEDHTYLNMMPTFYDGELIESLPNGRDRVLLPGPCFRTNIAIHHAASGGPVFCLSGSVFGVNSTGFDGTEDSYVSRINEIFALRIDDIVINEPPARSVPVIEIARAGHIVVDRTIALINGKGEKHVLLM